MIAKPPRWAVNPALIDPAWKWAWRDLKFLVTMDDLRPVDLLSMTRPDSVIGSPQIATNKFGQSVRLDGDATKEVQLRYSRTFSVPGFTWFAVVHPTHIGDHAGVIFADAETESAPNGFQTRNGGTAFHWDGTTRTDVITGGLVTGSDHVVIVRWSSGNPINVRIWRNGQQVINTDSVGTPTNNASIGPDLMLGGGESPSLDRVFGGDYGIAALWGRALTDAEVVQLASDPFGPIRPRLGYSREQTWSEATGLRAIPGAGL